MKIPIYIKSFIVGIPIGITVLDVVGYIARVDGISMQPALNPDKRTDYVFLNRWAVRSLDVKRGEIISLISPKDPEQKIIKRIVGVQGDVISTLGYKKEIVRIPEGHCWVEGDHTGHSMDSNNFGPVSLGLITAKASYIVWPPSRWQHIEPFLPNSRVPLNLTAFVYGMNGLTLGDVDNDGIKELVVGGVNGNVAVFKGAKKWITLEGLQFISCIAIGDLLNQKKNCLVIITGDGWCHIYCTITQPVSVSDSSGSFVDDRPDEVDGAIFSSESLESDKSTSSDSIINSSIDPEQTVLKCIHIQRIPANTKHILLADIDGDGLIEMVLGLTDRVVRSYRWTNNFKASKDVLLENITGELVSLSKWECASQVGSITLHTCNDGAPSILVAQPGGTFMRIICQSEEEIMESLEDSDSESIVGSKIDYQFLGINRMRDQNVSTEILGNLKAPPDDYGTKPYAVATLDGTVMLVKDERILWAIAFDHQIFAITKLDVTNNGSDDIVACSWDGQTYILDQHKNCVRFQLEESVQAFTAGYYNTNGDTEATACFVYVTFHDKIYIYYDIPLKQMVCKKFVPDDNKLKDILIEEYTNGETLDQEAKKRLVEYLLYGVKN